MALHLYGQWYWHQPAFIVGNREELSKLHNALAYVLGGGDPIAVDTLQNDGEGYPLVVALKEDMDEMLTAYHDDCAVDNSKTRISPYKLYNFKKEQK